MIAATFTDRLCNLLSIALEIGITQGTCVRKLNTALLLVEEAKQKK
jgi:hypothetical protein